MGSLFIHHRFENYISHLRIQGLGFGELICSPSIRSIYFLSSDLGFRIRRPDPSLFLGYWSLIATLSPAEQKPKAPSSHPIALLQPRYSTLTWVLSPAYNNLIAPDSQAIPCRPRRDGTLTAAVQPAYLPQAPLASATSSWRPVGNNWLARRNSSPL